MKKYKIGMLIFPELTIQDFVGPYDVFIRAACFKVLIVSENTQLMKAEGGLSLIRPIVPSCKSKGSMHSISRLYVQALCYWRSIELLQMLGVEAVKERVVTDRNRITGGGITAGIDFGLVLTALIGGEDLAKTIQLLLEYNPLPPFDAGSPETAESHIIQKAREITRPLYESRARLIQQMVLEQGKPQQT